MTVTGMSLYTGAQRDCMFATTLSITSLEKPLPLTSKTISCVDHAGKLLALLVTCRYNSLYNSLLLFEDARL